MDSASINVSLDADVKRQLEAFCAKVGVSMSTAINIFMRRVLRNSPDQLELDFYEPNAETIEAFEEAERILANPGSVKVYKSVDELAKEFNF